MRIRFPRRIAGSWRVRTISASLHPFRKARYLGSGPGEMVLAEAGLDGESQARAIADDVDTRRSSAGVREMDV